MDTVSSHYLDGLLQNKDGRLPGSHLPPQGTFPSYPLSGFGFHFCEVCSPGFSQENAIPQVLET